MEIRRSEKYSEAPTLPHVPEMGSGKTRFTLLELFFFFAFLTSTHSIPCIQTSAKRILPMLQYPEPLVHFAKGC